MSASMDLVPLVEPVPPPLSADRAAELWLALACIKDRPLTPDESALFQILTKRLRYDAAVCCVVESDGAHCT